MKAMMRKRWGDVLIWAFVLAPIFSFSLYVWGWLLVGAVSGIAREAYERPLGLLVIPFVVSILPSLMMADHWYRGRRNEAAEIGLWIVAGWWGVLAVGFVLSIVGGLLH